MQIFQLRAFDLLCLHIYFILFIQLAANWSNYNCGFNMSFALLSIYIIYLIRVVIAQARRIAFSWARTEEKERLIIMHASIPCSIQYLNVMKYTTEAVLIGINIFLIVMMAENKNAFKPPVCEARDLFALLIAINFIICIKSAVNIIIQNRKSRAVR